MSILVSQIWLHVHHILVSERSTWGSLPTIQEPVAKRRAPCWMPLQFVPRAARRSPLHGRVQSLYHSFDLKNTAKWLLTFQPAGPCLESARLQRPGQMASVNLLGVTSYVMRV